MKKLIAIVMSMVLVLVAGVSCFNPNKETEAEYKARIKKELDTIHVEATGYKFEVQDSSVGFPYKFVEADSVGLATCKMETQGHSYDITIFGANTDSDEYGFEISVDVGETKKATFNYEDKFKDFGSATLCFFDGKIFIKRAKSSYGLYKQPLNCFFPSTLFIYDYDENTIKYMGYWEKWFELPIYDRSKGFILVITKED